MCGAQLQTGCTPNCFSLPLSVNLSAPTAVNEGRVITYTADVSYSGTSALNYTWTVSPTDAKFSARLGTPTISVDSTGLGNKSGLSNIGRNDGSGEATCRQVTYAATNVARIPKDAPEAGEYDVCCSCAFDDQKARLDNLAVELQNDHLRPHTSGYGGRTSRREKLSVSLRGRGITLLISVAWTRPGW